MSIYRSSFWNFTIALLAGIALGAAGAVHVITTRVEKANAAATEKWLETYSEKEREAMAWQVRAEACADTKLAVQ